MESKQSEKLEIILDYSGEKIKNHTMDVREFTKSLNGFYDLLKSAANKNGFKDEEIKIEIKDVDEGCIQAVLIFILGVVSTHYLEKILEKIDSSIVKIFNDVKNFIKIKKQISNKQDVEKFKIYENLSNSELLNDINCHKYLDDFTSCLDTEVENIDIETNNKNIEKLNINRSERLNLSYIPEAENSNENLIEEDMVLYLDGIQGSTEKWHFFKKSNDKKTKLTAEVLSKKLLEFGKDTSYTDYSNIPLYCKVTIKTFLKEGNKNKTNEYYIVDCNFKEENDLLNNFK